MSNFVTNKKVTQPLFEIGQILTSLFSENNWDKRKTPYICKILNVEKKEGFNLCEFYEYEVEIIDFDRTRSDIYFTERFDQKLNTIHKINEDDLMN